LLNTTCLFLVLFTNFSWLSVSASECQTVEVQPGEDVTLKYSSISKVITHTSWSRLDNVNRNQISCMVSMNGSAGDAAFCHGAQDGKFDMSFYYCSLITKLACLTMTAMTVLLVRIIIGLLVKIPMLQTAHKEEHSHQEQNPGSDDVIYAEVRFPPKARRNNGSASERQLETQQVDSGNKQ
uniref:Immunoglobulin V-set domain-containing protein n=1 Tax=Amphilophus citrinellus TaxID=61819 RepID=A0A3Q0SVE3_AMPCI